MYLRIKGDLALGENAVVHATGVRNLETFITWAKTELSIGATARLSIGHEFIAEVERQSVNSLIVCEQSVRYF